MVLDARVHLIGPNGERDMPITDFYQLDGMTRNVLQTRRVHAQSNVAR